MRPLSSVASARSRLRGKRRSSCPWSIQREEQLDLGRLMGTLRRLQASEWLERHLPRPGPMAFPLLAEWLNNRMGNQSLLERLEALRRQAERAEGL